MKITPNSQTEYLKKREKRVKNKNQKCQIQGFFKGQTTALNRQTY